VTNTLTRRSPWPHKILSDYWGPHYRLGLRSPDNPELLVVTESGLVVASNETDAVGLTFTRPDPHEVLLEVGMARSDLPKELQSSWKLQWASFGTNAPCVTLGSNSEAVQYWHDWLEACSQGKNAEGGGVQAIIFGSFVRPTKNSHPWVEVMRGDVRQIRCDHEGWIDLLIETASPDTEDQQKNRVTPSVTEPKDLKLTLVMLATLAVWVFKFTQFLITHDRTATTPPADYAFFNLTHGAMQADWVAHSAVVAFIVIHHLRMAVGVEFAGRDSSFFRAKLHAPFVARTSLEWAESLFLAVIVSFSVLLTYFVGSADYFATSALLFVQALLVILYDWVFRDALLKYDEGRRANYLLVAGDIMFLVVTSVILLNRILAGPATGLAFGTNRAAILTSLCWIYFGLFFVEVLFAYQSAIRSAIREIVVAFRHLKNPTLWYRRRRDSGPSSA
jgi:hypothetical protein